MTKEETLRKIKEGRIDHRLVRSALRFPSLVKLTNENQEQIATHEDASKAQRITFTLTRRGHDLIA